MKQIILTPSCQVSGYGTETALVVLLDDLWWSESDGDDGPSSDGDDASIVAILSIPSSMVFF